MAVKVVTKSHTFGEAGAVLLSTIMGKPAMTWIGSLAVRASRTNADDVSWADESGVQGGYIGPSEAVTMDFGEGQTLVQKFMLSGTPGDTIYLTIGMNLGHAETVVTI